MKNDLLVAGFQMDLIWENPEANMDKITRMIASLSKSPDLIVLPEMFSTGFTMNISLAEKADEVHGKVLPWMMRQARETGAVITGSLPVATTEGCYNRLIWADPQGWIQSYDKRHTFAFAGENKYYKSGTERMIGLIGGWKILPLVCYDLRFPVWSRNGWVKNEASYDVLVYVANWPSVRSHAWKSLLIARAIENQSYTIGINRTGKDGNNHPYQGDSMIVDFKGEILSKLQEEEGLVTYKLNREELESFRNKFPFLADADRFQMLN